MVFAGCHTKAIVLCLPCSLLKGLYELNILVFGLSCFCFDSSAPAAWTASPDDHVLQHDPKSILSYTGSKNIWPNVNVVFILNFSNVQNFLIISRFKLNFESQTFKIAFGFWRQLLFFIFVGF